MNFLVIVLCFVAFAVLMLRELYVKPIFEIIDECQVALFCYDEMSARDVDNLYVLNKFIAEQKFAKTQLAVKKIQETENSTFTHILMSSAERDIYARFMQRLPEERLKLEEAIARNQAYFN